MNRRSNGKPSQNPHNPAPSSPNTGEDPFAYLAEGAIYPPTPPKAYRRTTTRRGFIAAGLATIGATAWYAVPLNTAGSFYPGTMVGNLSIAELSYDEARQRMRAHFAAFEHTAVDFIFGDQQWSASLQELGYTIDYEATLAAAWRNGRDASRGEQLRNILRAPETRTYPVLFQEDTEVLRGFLQDIGSQIVGAGHDASLYLDADQVRIEPDVNGRRLDIDTAMATTQRAVLAAQYSTIELTSEAVSSQITADMLVPKRDLAQIMINGPIQIRVDDDTWQVSQSTLREALVLPASGVLTDPTLDERILAAAMSDIAPTVERAPVNAVLGWDGGLYVVEPDVRGRALDTDATVQAILAVARERQNRVAEAQYQEFLADVRTDNIYELGIAELIAVGDSNFEGSAPERAENVRVSAKHLTHTLVPPGEMFSFNQAIGPITLDNDFVQGKIIRGSRIVEDIGGGACQASTTVFRAALRAGFPIKHHYHQFRLKMYEYDGWPPGLDAAIFQPDDPTDWELDLEFRNITDHWVLVEFVIDGAHAYCRLYGTSPGWDVDISVPFISEAREPKEPVETEDSNLARGERMQVGFATNGYDVQAVRRITRNGELVQFESMRNPWEFWSYFQPQRDEYLIGPGTPRELPASTPDAD